MPKTPRRIQLALIHFSHGPERMHQRTVSSLAKVALTAFSTTIGVACSRADSAPPVDRVARLTAIDTLVESDSFYVARLTRAFIAPDGHVFVSDQVQRRVVEFDTGGKPVMSFGRDGDGPGEFRGPTAMTTWGADSVVVTDITTRRVSVFRRSDGDFLWHAPGLGSVASVAPRGASLVVASLMPDSLTTIGILSAGSRAFRAALPIPDSLVRQQLGLAAFPRSVVAVSPRHVVVAVLWSDVAFVSDTSLSPQYSFLLPRRTRRPIPPNLDEALQAATGANRFTIMPLLSTIEVLQNGWLVFVHKDWTAPPGGVADAARVTIDARMRVFATIVDLENRRACADIELPADWAENPHFVSDGSTMVGIGHAVTESARPTLEVRRFDLSLESCVWEPLLVALP